MFIFTKSAVTSDGYSPINRTLTLHSVRMVQAAPSPPEPEASPHRPASGDISAMRIAGAVLAVLAVGAILVVSGDRNPAALEMLSNHHLKHAVHRLQTQGEGSSDALIQSDAARMKELTSLVNAADEQAKKASELQSTEESKLRVAPDSKVDAEMMLAHEARDKGEKLEEKVTSLRENLREIRKKLREANHKARQEGRILHKVDGEKRDGMIALHDKEMKVLEARHDVQNAAKDGNVAALRDAQKRLADRKDIAKGARAEFDQELKKRDQVAAKHRLLEKRVQILQQSMNTERADVHNDDLKAEKENAASLAIGARANYLRDKAALTVARSKYASLAQLLDDPSTDHEQVESTLSKIASNVHLWQKLQKSDEKDMEKKAEFYKKAKERLKEKSITLASQQDTESLLETYALAGQITQSLQQQYAYPTQQMQQYAPAQQQAQQYAQPQPQYAAPQYAAQPAPANSAMAAAPAPQPAVMPGTVGNVPYVYNDKQYLPSAAPNKGYDVVWLFADNKTPDMLYFGYQSADGVMHVYNEIKPNSVTRQQAFANEYWTILAADKHTVAVQPFKITQHNQWLSIGSAQPLPTLAAK